MPEVTVNIGGKGFAVACQPGEEEYLRSAAALLDREAQALAEQIGRLPDAKMLLMAGLMLADRTAALQDKVTAADSKLARQEKLIADMGTLSPPAPEQVPVIPAEVYETLTELAARAESAADALEAKTAG